MEADTRESSASDTRALFAPFQLRGLTLQNRLIKEATFEAGAPGGIPGPSLIAHHAEMARGGVGLTTVAYAAVSPNGRSAWL